MPGRFLASALPASAQDKGQWGIDLAVASSTASAGATFHLSNRVALRPTIAFCHSTTDSPQTFVDGNISFPATISSSTTSFNPGLEALFYLSRGDALSTYVAASYQHTHSGQNSSLAAPGEAPTPEISRDITFAANSTNRTSTSNGNVLGAAFGLQYVIHKRFSVFGEVGLRYSTSRSDTTLPPGLILSGNGFGPSNTKQFGALGTALGVIFYLK